MRADSYVRARIPAEMKDRAIEALDKMGLSVSDVIRLTLLRVAADGRLPFAVEIPNATTRAAMAELEAGKGREFANVAELAKALSSKKC